MSASIQLGPFDFRFTPEDVKAYRTALGFPAGTDIPLTFYSRVFTEPMVMAELRNVIGGHVPIHLEQSIDVTEILRPDNTYNLTLNVDRLHDSRASVTATCAAPLTGRCAVMRGEFLLAALPEAA